MDNIWNQIKHVVFKKTWNIVEDAELPTRTNCLEKMPVAKTKSAGHLGCVQPVDLTGETPGIKPAGLSLTCPPTPGLGKEGRIGGQNLGGDAGKRNHSTAAQQSRKWPMRPNAQWWQHLGSRRPDSWPLRCWEFPEMEPSVKKVLSCFPGPFF